MITAEFNTPHINLSEDKERLNKQENLQQITEGTDGLRDAVKHEESVPNLKQSPLSNCNLQLVK